MQRRYLSLALVSFIVLGVSSAVLPRARGLKRNLIRSGVFGGAPMEFKDSNDYYRKQSNDPYRRKLSVKPLVDLAPGLWDEGLDSSQPARAVDLASLFNKNGIFYLSAPGRAKPGQNEKSLLQKQLDQDYISLELLGSSRGQKSRYPKKRGSYLPYSNNKGQSLAYSKNRGQYLPYSNKKEQYSPYSNKGQNLQYSNKAQYSPYSKNRGQYLPYSNKKEQYSPYSNKGQDLQYSNKAQYTPYSNNRGQYLPYSNKKEQYSLYSNKGQDLQYSNKAQYSPYSNKRGQYLPYLKNEGQVTTSSKKFRPVGHKRPLYGDRDDLVGFQDLVNLVQSYGKQKNGGKGSQKYRNPAGIGKKGLLLPSYKQQKSVPDPLVGQAVGEGRVHEDEDYKEEVLAILRDVRQRGAELEEEDALQEFRFEELVS